MKTLQCRDHGGTFTVIPKRGRPPVRCSPDNVCTRFKGTGSVTERKRNAAQIAKLTADRHPEAVGRKPRSKTPNNGLSDVGERMRQEYMSKLAEAAPETPN